MGSQNRRLESQNNRLAAFLATGKGITTLEAYRKLGITRLAARIFDLEKRGYPINRTWVTVENRFQEECQVVEYSLGTNQMAIF